ncbi:hypothetical protein BDR26DRAFT_852641 [Obelidium mucronatum]|nr:hypothetical protein BDR26DRAFT_852641 [Obelidium mucronatum]
MLCVFLNTPLLTILSTVSIMLGVWRLNVYFLHIPSSMDNYRKERALDPRGNLVLDIDDVILRAKDADEPSNSFPFTDYPANRIHNLTDGGTVVLASNVIETLITLSANFRIHLVSNAIPNRVEAVRALLNALTHRELVEKANAFSSNGRYYEFLKMNISNPRCKTLLSIFPEVPSNCIILDDTPRAWDLSQTHLVLLIKNIPKNEAWDVNFNNPRRLRLLDHLHNEYCYRSRSFEDSLKYQLSEMDTFE